MLVLTSADRAVYQLAPRILDPLGVSVESAALQFAEAVKRLGSVPLGDAVAFYLHWRPKEPTVRTVPEVVTEFVDSKELARLSNVRVKSLRYMLSKFGGRFKGPIGEVTGPEIDVWLRQTGLSARTRNNVRGAIGSLFNFAKRERYLPRDHNELEAVSLVKEPPTEIEVFTPAELTEILCFTPARLIPFMVLGAFAGVRHVEIQRLDWRDIQLEEGHLVVRAAKAKTASRRIVPLVANLREWLGPVLLEEGPVCELTNMANEIHDIVMKINAG